MDARPRETDAKRHRSRRRPWRGRGRRGRRPTAAPPNMPAQGPSQVNRAVLRRPELRRYTLSAVSR
eukprot:2420625-Prymnesium_polylepis.1